MVYGQLWRNAGRNWNVHNRQPDFDYHLLRALGDRKLRQLLLRDDNGHGKSTSRGSDFGLRDSGLDLLAVEQHVDGYGRFGNDLRVVYRQLRWNGGWNWNIDNRQPNFYDDLLRPLGE